MRNLVLLIAGLLAFGAAGGLIRYSSPIVGFWIANMSAFWLLLSFLAGCLSERWSRAAVAAVLATMLGLVSYYAVEMLHRDTGVQQGGRYFMAGLLSAPIMGAVGWAWRRYRWRLVPVGLALVFLAEPFAWDLWLGWLPAPVTMWSGEAAFGVALAIVLLGDGRRHRANSVAV